ncbi:hypothetical protein PC110_g20819 [Phytophthora cactorum]|uniref:ZSWIM1/3 RNaseH-like domain-containing protein n=2 Tax=Phytophthora cactorum TaxID=29920 RepID=A0A329RHD2_9STRA|nr:hypothetical protein PC110_g20819 [Phytophthora cactorum]
MERAASAASDPEADDAPTPVQNPHAHVPPTAEAHSPEDHVPSSTLKTYFVQPMQKREFVTWDAFFEYLTTKSLYATYKTKEARRGSITVESRLDCCFREFCSHEGNTATVYVDGEKLSQTIRFQTHQMRWFFEAFPEVMMVDATRNTNDARYKLFSFMIHDVFGHGQFAQHALMENESTECLTNAVTSSRHLTRSGTKPAS